MFVTRNSWWGYVCRAPSHPLRRFVFFCMFFSLLGHFHFMLLLRILRNVLFIARPCTHTHKWSGSLSLMQTHGYSCSTKIRHHCFPAPVTWSVVENNLSYFFATIFLFCSTSALLSFLLPPWPASPGLPALARLLCSSALPCPSWRVQPGPSALARPPRPPRLPGGEPTIALPTTRHPTRPPHSRQPAV